MQSAKLSIHTGSEGETGSTFTLINTLNVFFLICAQTEILNSVQTDIHVSLRMKCNNFGDPLTFRVAPSSGQHVHLSSTLVHELMTS